MEVGLAVVGRVEGDLVEEGLVEDGSVVANLVVASLEVEEEDSVEDLEEAVEVAVVGMEEDLDCYALRLVD